MSRSPHTSRKRNDRGVVAIEFVLVAPILFMLIFAVAEFGAFFEKKTDVTGQAYNAARSLALTGSVGALPAGNNVASSSGCGGAATNAVVTISQGTYTFSVPFIPLGSQPLVATGRFPCNPTS